MARSYSLKTEVTLCDMHTQMCFTFDMRNGQGVYCVLIVTLLMKITEGERVKPDQTAQDSAYWLGRIMRALIVGFGSGNRLDQTGKVRCPGLGHITPQKDPLNPDPPIR